MKHLRSLNVASLIYLVGFVLIVTGIIPRSSALILGAATALWMILMPLEDALSLFTRLIPFFIALPLTAQYDNLTLWRPLALILGLRFVLQRDTIHELRHQWTLFRSSPAQYLRAHPIGRRLSILLVLAGLSLIGAAYPLVGLKRIIYFVNLLIVPIIVFALLRREALKPERLMRDIAWTTIGVVIVGFIQLASTYLIDIYQFMRLWGEQIQFNQYGQEWSAIAVTLGNTWLAYYGDQLSLRVFSVFPDSHSFPTFVLLGIPALMTLARRKIWVPLALLAAILSGTRGIWAASVGVAGLAVLLYMLMPRLTIDGARRRVFAWIGSYIAIFFLLFTIAWPIFISPQFLLSKGDWRLLGNRIRSIIDLGETSNSQRIAIWKASVQSIGEHPFLGVGIGNFPVVLGQNIQLARAGSTAHNLYLHVAAEMGLLALFEGLLILASPLLAAWHWFRTASGSSLAYAAALLLYLPWVYLYVLTDPIIFDERVFLLLGITLAMAWAHDKS